MKKKAPQTLDLTVVGIQHRVTMVTRRMIAAKLREEGPMKCHLVREPSNPHDENAIKVMISEGAFKGLHLGYVTRAVASVLAPRLTKGTAVFKSGYIVTLDPRDGEAEMVVKLYVSNAKTLENKLKRKT
jgi:hypothetical protein